MTDRAPGFYWVRQKFMDGSPQGWEVGRFEVGLWALPGDSDEYQTAELYEIGERVERQGTREESIAWAVDLARQLHIGWPEPQPITDAQKTGERFLLHGASGWKIGSWRAIFGFGSGWRFGWIDDHDDELIGVSDHLQLPPAPRST